MGGLLFKKGHENITDLYESPWDIEVETIHGEKKLLREYVTDKKIILIINVASK